MVSIEVERGTLIVRLHGWDRLWSLRNTLQVPLSHVASVRPRPDEAWRDDVVIDASLGVDAYEPCWMATGNVHFADGPAFYDVRDPARAIAIDLVQERFRHIVVEVDDPERAANSIRRALTGDHGKSAFSPLSRRPSSATSSPPSSFTFRSASRPMRSRSLRAKKASATCGCSRQSETSAKTGQRVALPLYARGRYPNKRLEMKRPAVGKVEPVHAPSPAK